MIPLLLLAVTATFQPARPTVGDPIAIEFRQPVALDPSPDYEVVSQSANRVVVRTFLPKPFALSGRTDGVAFRNLVVPVRSVLKEKDDLQPAPLAPPVAEPYPRLANVALAIAAAFAALAWLAAWLVARRRNAATADALPQLPPLERYRATVVALRDRPNAPKRWAALADATRAYLAATNASLGAELTTTELLAAAAAAVIPTGREGPGWGGDPERAMIDGDGGAVAAPPAPQVPRSARDDRGRMLLGEILRQGDLEKFSPWGAQPADFAAVANRALTELAPEPVAEEAAA